MKKVFSRILLVVFISTAIHTQSSSQVFTKEAFKYIRFLEFLDRFYVDSVNTDKIVEDAIIHQLEEMDPHSTYINKADFDKMNEPLQGNFEGIGVSFNILRDTLFVISPIVGGPSEKVGIQSGDRILKVDGKNIAGIKITNEIVYSLLRGTKGTKVTVSILRRNEPSLIDYTIIRDKIPINSLDASYVVGDGLGYIKLSRFAMTSNEEFLAAANDLKNKGVNNLILDLTDNAGGYLDVAASLADQFMGDKKLIVYTQGIHTPREDKLATSNGLFENGKLVILIDEGSASASEIVAGAIQDWDRGIIIGRRSFGKGLVQRQLTLPDESVIRLTIARYYTPSGRLIQKSYKDGAEEYGKEIYERYEHGEFNSADSIKFPDSLKYKTLVKQRTVYGGGGIMPDIFVPIDTSSYSDYFRDIIRKGILNQFVLQYVDKNRSYFKNTYTDFAKFKQEYTIGNEILTELNDYAQKEGVKFKQSDFDISVKQLKISIKAYIARDIWGTNEFYEIMNQNDNNFLKAVEVIKNWDDYQKKLMQ
jgi:carboxyl-terminal processing protease